MAQKYLDYDGLLYFWQKLKNYFVTDVTYASSSRKIQKTKAGTTSDVVTLATVATSGSYNDLTNKPTIPNVKDGANLEVTSFDALSSGAILGTEYDIGTTSYTDQLYNRDAIDGMFNTALGSLATVATSGSYNDLTDTPTIPAGVEPSTTTPKMDGTATVGTETKFARGDHIHPTDTSRVPTTRTVNGHALSSNVTVTASDIGVESGAEVNQNAFSNVKVGSTTISADTKTDTLELVAGTNVTLTPDATNDKVTIDASHPTYTSFTGKPTSNQTPGFGSTFTISQISQSTTGQVSGTDRTVKIPDTVASSSANGLMSSTDKDKLDGISGQTLDLVAGNNITITPNTTSGTLTITATNTTYPSGTSTELSNGSVTATRVWTPKILHDYVAGEIQTAITGAVAYQGIAPTTFAPTNYQAGWYWIVGTAGTYCGQVCEAGDMIFCKTAGTAYSASNFDVVQTNLDITAITNAEIDTIMAS